MNRKSKLIWLALVVAGLNGCATMSSDECMTSDWSAIGYEDGSRGYTMERLTRHRKACAKHGVTPDFAAYQNGRDQGLVDYCQPGRGFKVGSNGGSYNGVCSVNLEASFLDAYNAGYQLYSLRSNVSRASNSIHSKEHELHQIEDLITEKEVAVILNEMALADRVLLLADLKELSERTGQLETEIRNLYEIRARSQVELEHYQIVVADMGY